MEKGEVRKWDRGRGLARMNQRSVSTNFPCPLLTSTVPTEDATELYQHMTYQEWYLPILMLVRR